MRLSIHTREDHLARMAERPLDVLVIGGGVTGCAVALDAASRGLRTGLVEAADFASGTSGRSSKMVHGGLRYLAHGEVGLVRESLAERNSLQRRAPQLVRPLTMMLPVYGGKLGFHRFKLGAGLWVYDLLGARKAGVRHTWLDVSDVMPLLPTLDPANLRGALAYADAQADDARVVTLLLRTAAINGALVANYTRVEELLRDGDHVAGALVHDQVRDRMIELEAHVTINATGVWADTVIGDLHSVHQHNKRRLTLTPSRGVHLTVDGEKLDAHAAMAFYAEVGNSNVFIEPWYDGLAFIGTTDDAYTGPLDAPQATPADVQRLLGIINRFLREPLTNDDVVSAWAGLRPLVASDHGGSTEDASREHITMSSPGFVTITGGKLTTHRAMAEDAVNRAVEQLPAHIEPGSCVTDLLPLDGAMPNITARTVDAFAREFAITRSTARHLLRRYGTRAADVLAPARREPALFERLHPERPYLLAEARWAAAHEMAIRSGDVLFRTTRLALETRDSGERARSAVEQELAGVVTHAREA